MDAASKHVGLLAARLVSTRLMSADYLSVVDLPSAAAGTTGSIVDSAISTLAAASIAFAITTTLAAAAASLPASTLSALTLATAVRAAHDLVKFILAERLGLVSSAGLAFPGGYESAQMIFRSGQQVEVNGDDIVVMRLDQAALQIEDVNFLNRRAGVQGVNC